jgi:hypothetical protein
MLNLKGEVAGMQFNVVTSEKGGHSPMLSLSCA